MLRQLLERLRGRKASPNAAPPDEFLFLRRGHKLVHELLLQDRAFPPFGDGQGLVADPVCIMSEDGSTETVRQKLAEGCAAGRFVSVAVFVMADIEEPSSGEVSKALVVYFDRPGPGTTCRRSVSVYSFDGNEL